MCERTWQASHSRRPRLFVGYIPDQERWQSNQGPKRSISYAYINSVDSHYEIQDDLSKCNGRK